MFDGLTNVLVLPDKMPNMVHKRFGRLVVVGLSGKDKYRNLLWLCRCDCGGNTIQRTNTLNMGLVRSCGCLSKEILRDKHNEKNPQWKGDNVGLIALHRWVRNRKPKPLLCECCGVRKPYDLANVSGEYKRDINDFEWLCRRCHMELDDRMNRRKPNGQFERLNQCQH